MSELGYPGGGQRVPACLPRRSPATASPSEVLCPCAVLRWHVLPWLTFQGSRSGAGSWAWATAVGLFHVLHKLCVCLYGNLLRKFYPCLQRIPTLTNWRVSLQPPFSLLSLWKYSLSSSPSICRRALTRLYELILEPAIANCPDCCVAAAQVLLTWIKCLFTVSVGSP